jgi:hypothetical protein
MVIEVGPRGRRLVSRHASMNAAAKRIRKEISKNRGYSTFWVDLELSAPADMHRDFRRIYVFGGFFRT